MEKCRKYMSFKVFSVSALVLFFFFYLITARGAATEQTFLFLPAIQLALGAFLAEGKKEQESYAKNHRKKVYMAVCFLWTVAFIVIAARVFGAVSSMLPTQGHLPPMDILRASLPVLLPVLLPSLAVFLLIAIHMLASVYWVKNSPDIPKEKEDHPRLIEAAFILKMLSAALIFSFAANIIKAGYFGLSAVLGGLAVLIPSLAIFFIKDNAPTDKLQIILTAVLCAIFIAFAFVSQVALLFGAVLLYILVLQTIFVIKKSKESKI